MIFNGQKLIWQKYGSFKATSGMPGFQHPKYMCFPNEGPVPEGLYYIPLIEGGYAEDDGSGKCNLKPSWQIQKIPRDSLTGDCEIFWTNWGKNRVRFEPANKITENACPKRRGGFYIHDSTKGYSHGCIEIETSFFIELRKLTKRKVKKKLYLKIKYTPGKKTNGGTYVP